VDRISIVTALVDAALALARGQKKSGLLLFGAAAFSSRLPGLGTAISLFLRFLRWVR